MQRFMTFQEDVMTLGYLIQQREDVIGANELPASLVRPRNNFAIYPSQELVINLLVALAVAHLNIFAKMIYTSIQQLDCVICEKMSVVLLHLPVRLIFPLAEWLVSEVKQIAQSKSVHLMNLLSGRWC